MKAGQSSMKAWHSLCIFLLGILAPIFAQQAPPRPNSGSPNPLITLDVVVTNKAGVPQAGLQQQDFTLFDNKAPQKITSFQAVDGSTTGAPPVEVILFMDTMNAGTQTVIDERSQITRYLRRNSGKLTNPTSIVVFANTGLKNLGEPTLDGNALSTLLAGNDVIGLRTMHSTAAGARGASERLVSSLRNLYSIAAFEANKPGRKILICISPGWPASGVDMFSEIKEQLFSTLVMVSTSLQQSRITLYSIDPEGAGGGNVRNRFSYESYLKGITAAKYISPANMSLPVFVTHSGGQVLTTGNDIGAQIDDCVLDTRAYYILSFEGSPTERPDEYHAIDIKVTKPGLTVRTATGYYAQPEQRLEAPQQK
jgi:VWFA-related protein